MKTVAVIEGFAGGPMLSQLFRKELQKSGFKIIKDKMQADIIIAHSAGCYVLPKNTSAGLIMFIGPSYWPDSPIIKRWFRKVRSDNHYTIRHFGWRFFIRKKGLEFYYIFRRPMAAWHAISKHRRLSFLDRLNKKVILIRNSNDKFCSPKIKQAVSKMPDVRFYELPGEHDDYYTNPRPYIALIPKDL